MGAMQPSLGGGDFSSAMNAAIAQRAMQYATPQQLPQIQHSAMLAEALQSIQKSGSQNLRTKGALASNLLAEALLAMASNKANKQVAQTDQGNWNNVSGTMAGMIPGLNGSDTPPAPQAGPPASAPPPAAPSQPAQSDAAPAPAPQPPATQLSDADRHGLANAMWGEARGEPTAGQQAVADVILNRARQTGQPVSAVVAQPHQFAGYNPNRQLSPQQEQAMLDAAAPALAGTDITHGADHFYNPSLASPKWGAVSGGQMIGQHRFLALGDQGAQSAASTGTPAAAQAPMPQPLQVSTGPQPSMPGPNPGANSPSQPAPANSAPQGAAPSSVQGQGQWALGPVPIQPQQRQRLQQLGQLAQTNPAFRQPFMEYAQELQKQATTPEPFEPQIINGTKVLIGKVTGRQVIAPVQGLPIEAKAMMASDGRGGFAPVPSTQDRQLQGAAPGVRTQQDIAGHISDTAIANAVQSGQVYDPASGGYRPLAGLQPHITPAGGGGAVMVQEPGKGPQLVQGPVTAEMVAKRGEQFTGRDEVKAARSSLEAMNAYNRAMQTIAPSGVVGQAGIDAYIHAVSSPNQGVRQGPVNVFLEHQNLPDEVKGEAQRLFGQGFLTPQVLKQIGQMVWLYTNERVKTAQGLSQTDTQWAKQGGFDPGALGESSPQMMPVPAYIQDAPPPMNTRHSGMVVWSPKGPVKWNGKGWDPANG